jgi:organic radical activating enzyme
VPNLQNEKVGKKIDLYSIIMKNINKIDGITFSGGEPLFQEKELLNLLKKLPKNLDKMLFTGYYKNELNETQLKCFNYFDLVVEGRFEKNQMGNFLWRGSKNQIFSSPTKKYTHLLEKFYNSISAGLEVFIEDDEMIFYGIPTKNNEIEEIREKLTLNGLKIKN